MGMFDPNSTDLNTFNYQNQADQVKRQRDTAAQLLQTKPPQGQMVGNWYVKPSPLANIGSVLQTALGAYLMNKANDNQKSLDSNSLAAFMQQQNGLNAPIRDPNQDAVEAQSQDNREAARMQFLAPQPDGQSADAAPDNTYPIQGGPLPADPPSTAVPLPPVQNMPQQPAPVASVSPSAQQAAAKALITRPTDFGTGDGWDAPSSATDAISAGLSANPDDPTGQLTFQKMGDLGKALVRGIKKAYGFGDSAPDSVLAQGSTPPATPPAVPPMPAAPPQGATPPMPTPQAAPPMQAPQGPPQGASPQAPPQPMPQPPANPAAPGNGQLSLNGPAGPNPFAGNVPQQTPGQDTLTNGMTVNTSDPNPYSRAPTQNETVARLVALSRTSPEGQMIANAQLNQMFASKNGRFTTDVKPDPVNGGFVAVTTDSQTGNVTGIKQIGAGNGTMVTGQRTDQNGNVVNVHKDGSVTPMVGSNGAPVQDSAVTRSNADAVSSLVTKRSDAQSKLADLTKMESDLQLASGLVGQANVGPLAGTVGGVYNKFLGNSTANDTLDRVLNDTRLQQILQDKGGNGTVGAGLMRAYQGHSMSRDLAPAALSQGLGQALDTVSAQKQALQAEIGARNYALQQLGYKDPAAASPQGAPTTARAPGNYSF